MLSSVKSSRVRPKESTYLSTLRFLSVSWAELKLDTTRVAIPRHLRTEEQEAGEAPPAGRRPHLSHSPSCVCLLWLLRLSEAPPSLYNLSGDFRGHYVTPI